MNNMEWVDRKITKEQYEEGIRYEEERDFEKRKELAEDIAGINIVCGYGLYGYEFKKRIVEGEEQYFLAMHIGSSCD